MRRRLLLSLLVLVLLLLSTLGPAQAELSSGRINSQENLVTDAPHENVQTFEVMPGTLVELRAGNQDTFTRIASKSSPTRAPKTATINVTYNGFSAEAQAAFQHAVDIWETQISSPLVIQVTANWTPLSAGVLGSAGATHYYRNFTNAPQANTWYPAALANAFNGTDLDSTLPDLEANFSSNFSNWYLGTDGNTPAGQYDFVTVVLHELGHGLGFAGSGRVSGGNGSWGSGTIYPFIYDRFVENGSGQDIIDTGLFANPSVALAVQLQGGDLFFNGANAIAANGGTAPELYAPSTWDQGSSFSHLDETIYAAGNPNSLMTPQLGTAEAIHDPGDITRGMFRDMGWNIKSEVAAHMVVALDRSGSMMAPRTSGNTRCEDALTLASTRVNEFASSHPSGFISVRTFSGSSWTEITSGFVDKTAALAALNGLSPTGCSGGTPLADALCDGIDDMVASGAPAGERIIQLSSDGDENTSSGACSGPASVSSTAPYDAGSWHNKVWSNATSSATVNVDFFGTVTRQRSVDIETNEAVNDANSVPVTDYLQGLANETNGSYAQFEDNEALAAPEPNVELGHRDYHSKNIKPQYINDSILIGEEFEFTATFNNVGEEVGYGPFIQIMLPKSGIDGSDSGDPCDGLEFVSATFLDVTVDNELVSLTCPTASLPAPNPGDTVDVANPSPLEGEVTTIAGNEILTLWLPFGSFTPDQPAVEVLITAKVSEKADANTPLTIAARSGFLYGADAEGGPTIIDDTEADSANWDETLEINPEVYSLVKKYLGPEHETATGPNFPRGYELILDIADGQKIENLVLTDTLPNNVSFLSVVSTSPAGASVTPPATSIGGEVMIDFSSLGVITGTTSARHRDYEHDGDVTAIIEFYVPERDADGDLILDRNTCAFAESVNEVEAQANWEPQDPRDLPSIMTGSDEHILADKCLAIQKGVSPDRGVVPGDTLNYTLNFQVSDFFEIGDLVVEDWLSDGQTFVPGSVKLRVSDQNGSVASSTFPLTDMTIGAKCSGTDDSTPITFDVSAAMQALGHPNGYLTGGHAGPAPTSAGATGTITFEAIIDDEFSCPPVPGNVNVDEYDALTNKTEISGTVLGITGDNPPPTPGVTARDGSGDVAEVAHGGWEKQIYAVNGDTNLSNPVYLRPEDEITFRLTYNFPAGDAEEVIIKDFLPLPILDVDDVGVGSWIFNGTASNTPPPVGTIRPMVGSITSTPATCSGYASAYAQSSGNSLCFDYGDRINPANTAQSIDLLFTIHMNTKPFVDQLKMTNTGQECQQNTYRMPPPYTNLGSPPFCRLAIDEFITSEPVLRINRKGIVATDNSNGQFQPGLTGQVPFTAPGSACPRFTAPVASADLSPAVNSNLIYVDANDKATYAVIVENTGTGRAFDVKVEDSLPTQVTPVPGTLCVRDGTGASLPFTGDFFSGGIQFSNPLAAGKETSGTAITTGANLIIITYDALLDQDIEPGTYTNKAEILNYAGAPGKENHVGSGFGGPFEDEAKVTVRPRASKSIVATSEAHTTGNYLTIGEIARYRLQVEVPEGILPATLIIDSLPNDLDMIDGTAKIAFVSNGTGISSSSPALSSLANVNGNESTIGTITPSVDFPSSNLSGGPSTYTYDLGDLSNRDDDDDREYVIIEFNALVKNTAANNAYNNKYNNFKVQVNGTQLASASVRAVIAEPNINLKKEVLNTPASANERAVYRVTLSNSGNSTAFDLDVQDILPSGLISLTVDSVISPTGTIVNDSSTDDELDMVIDSLAVGKSITIQYKAKLLANSSCDDIKNTVKSTYTSLPGAKGTVSNPTGSSTPGASGAEDGERDGSRTGANDYYKEATASLCPDLSIEKSHLGDFIPGKNAIYSLEVTNVGSGPTNGQVVVTDTLPSGLTYVSFSGAGWMANAWSCNATGQEVVCTHPGPINPSKTSIINLEVAVSSVSQIENCAQVSTAADNNPANNQSCDQTNICLPGEEPILTLDPVISTMAISDTVTVEVRAEDVTDTRSIQLQLHFDPTEVEVVDADTGRAGIQIEKGSCPQSDIVLINEANNTTGMIRYLASSTYESCYGDGVVAKITFRALKGGMSPVSFVNWGLSTSKGKHIELTCTQGMPLHVVPKGAIKGTVRLFGSVLDPEGVKVTLMDGTGAEVGTMTTAADGEYEFNDLPIGAYTLKAEKDMFLYALRTVLIQDGQTTVFPGRRPAGEENTVIVPELILWPGDSNGDDQVNLADLLPFSQLLNQGHDLFAGIQCANPPNWNPVSEALPMSVDFNGDCAVDIKDITIYNTTIAAFFNGCNGSVGTNVPIQCVAPGSKAKPALPLP